METILLVFAVGLLTYIAHQVRRIATHLDAQEVRYLKWHDTDHAAFTREEVAQQRAAMMNSMDLHSEAQANLHQVRNEVGTEAGTSHALLSQAQADLRKAESDANSGTEEYHFILEANARVAAGQRTIADVRQEWRQRFG